jgi:putative ABC transport system permease protein
MEIFNQTFAVTAVLRTISIAVAIGGVMLTLGILVLERTRDLGVLRSMGASTAQVARMMLAEAAIIGFLASLVGIASGSALALVLTWVINKAFFGWSIDLSYPWLELVLLPLWMTTAALVAGFFPALRAARIPPAAALRME